MGMSFNLLKNQHGFSIVYVMLIISVLLSWGYYFLQKIQYESTLHLKAQNLFQATNASLFLKKIYKAQGFCSQNFVGKTFDTASLPSATVPLTDIFLTDSVGAPLLFTTGGS